jgi:hypothetical protein
VGPLSVAITSTRHVGDSRSSNGCESCVASCRHALLTVRASSSHCTTQSPIQLCVKRVQVDDSKLVIPRRHGSHVCCISVVAVTVVVSVERVGTRVGESGLILLLFPPLPVSSYLRSPIRSDTAESKPKRETLHPTGWCGKKMIVCVRLLQPPLRNGRPLQSRSWMEGRWSVCASPVQSYGSSCKSSSSSSGRVSSQAGLSDTGRRSKRQYCEQR